MYLYGMFLKALHLVQFRSYQAISLHFSRQAVLITGQNGTGKTNLLDAIHHLSFSKGFLNPVDSQNIHEDEGFYVIRSEIASGDKEFQLHCGLKKGQKKVFKLNNKEYEKLAHHIGKFPLVVISPQDINLVLGGSEERRKFIDTVISQYDPEYLAHLIRYNKLLQQRNAFLKQPAPNEELLDVLDQQLVNEAEPLYTTRLRFLEMLQPLFAQNYQLVSNGAEQAGLSYDSKLAENAMATLLQQNRRKDMLLQHTSVGPHRDDLEMSIDGYPLRKFASQGQQKTFLIALKLAEFDLIYQLKNIKPFLLLDDIFEKLDQHRITALISLVNNQHFGQFFITDSHPERAADILNSIPCEFDHIRLPEEVPQTV
ncbi:MAG: DNA replication/repair protein RecF [Bacteroidia bacterium]|jgi:DNA replication and repair protein RecF|nr:DNA replication/repair protein RecF [Bacteroidia bacterium]MCC6769019.1 DNA replication/repair protein RecF [Bacteroidia bacterium]